jgi:hypothetical protein
MCLNSQKQYFSIRDSWIRFSDGCNYMPICTQA